MALSAAQNLSVMGLCIGAAGGDRPHPAGRGFACKRIPSIPVESQTIGSLRRAKPIRNGLVYWRGWRGSNPRPLASEANTLSTELQPHLNEAGKDTGFQSGSPREHLP